MPMSKIENNICFNLPRGVLLHYNWLMTKLIICGNYGATNLGDEAILDGILALVQNVQPQADITVLSANPADTRALHDIKSESLLPAGPRSFARGVFGGGIMKTFKVLQQADAVLLGGGGLFSDEKPMAVLIWSLQAGFAALLGKPLFCLGQSVGPLRTFFGRSMTKRVFSRARAVTVRDTNSQQVLHDLNLPSPEVLADPAFAVHVTEPLDSKREDFVVFSLRPWQKSYNETVYKSFAHLIDWLWQKHGLKSVLVPFSQGRENDSQFMNNIFVHVKNKNSAQIYEYSGDYRKVIELIDRCKAVIGMRLHSLIFSVMTQTPFMALSYTDKVASMAKDLEMDDYLLQWSNLTLDELKTGFKRLMDNYSGICLKLGEKNLLMRSKAREHEEILRVFFNSIQK